jgi:23S rRNA-/tRNA-specific pseudouridylate synthase
MRCLYTDRRHVMVVSKPAGIPMDGGQRPQDHPVTAAMAATQLAAALQVDEACVSPPRHCHQLDLSTSGVLVYALSPHASSAVADSFARRIATKHCRWRESSVFLNHNVSDCFTHKLAHTLTVGYFAF